MASRHLRYVVLLLSVLFLTTPFISVQFLTGDVELIASLVLKTNGGGFYPDYGLYIAEHLREIGIEVVVKIEEWIEYSYPFSPIAYDLAIRDLNFKTGTFDPYPFFSEESSLNYYGVDNFMPYGNQSEVMLKEGTLITDFEERKNHYNTWQNLYMDKILPFIPLFSIPEYIATWFNLIGFNSSWSIVDNLPYIHQNGFHPCQDDLKELIIADKNWRNLNPLQIDDESRAFVPSFLFEPLLQISPEGKPIKTGLIYDWDIINESYYKFYIREGIYWNPSYNCTIRNADSNPLSTNSTDLMVGLQGTSSDGYNQQLTAKDMVFTLLAYATFHVSEFAENYFWLKDIQIDNSDNFSFYITIDGNEKTTEFEPYAPFWNKLNVPCLPEFFLNSTSLYITNTSGNIPVRGLFEGIEDTIEWKDFDISSFGCGKYLLDYYVKNLITVLRANSNWHGIGAIDGMYHDLSIETIKIKVLMDTAPKINEFLAGRLDIVKIKYESMLFNNLEKDPLFRCHKLVSNSFSMLIFNLRRPFVGGTDNYLFLDIEGKENYTKGVAVRKAMCYSIDREEINQVLHGGNLIVSDYPIPEIYSNYYNPEIIKYSHDIDKALEWLFPGYDLNPQNPPIPNLLETLLIIGGGIILIGAIPTFFITKGLLDYRRSKKKPSETSTNNTDSIKDM